jgi:hypothetical protein
MGLKIPAWRLHFLESVFLHMIWWESELVFPGAGDISRGHSTCTLFLLSSEPKNCFSFLETVGRGVNRWNKSSFFPFLF